MTRPKLSVIIPAYNEERTIASIVEIVRVWGKADEIFVVNDGSRDGTVSAITQFKKSIRLISYRRNRGKGYALAQGIKKSTGTLLMFLDADLTGLTKKDLDAMLAPFLEEHADMVLGVARFTRVGSIEPFNELTGQRVIRRRDLIAHLRDIASSGYGIELLLNHLFERKRIVRVRLAHVFILGKIHKQAIPKVLASYITEARELLEQIVKLYAGDLPPQARRIVSLVFRYLKLAYKLID